MSKPVTRRAVLMSAASHRPTPHVYSQSRRCVVKDSLGDAVPAIEHIFTCTVTRAERRWGLDHDVVAGDVIS